MAPVSHTGTIWVRFPTRQLVASVNGNTAGFYPARFGFESQAANFMASKYEYTRRAIQKRRAWLDSLKSAPCSRCGIEYPPFVMDWHHVKPATKKFSLGRGSFRHSREAILAEIAKCILLCANCHRIVEYSTQSGLEVVPAQAHNLNDAGASPASATTTFSSSGQEAGLSSR